jgi:hypothetical protein
MRDHSLKHIVGFALLFVALFTVLFVGVVQVHNRSVLHHATAQNTPAAQHPSQP